MSQHAAYKFSVTIHTDDLAVVGCLRALAKFAQMTGNNNIPWGGTKDEDWKRASHNVTFRFNSQSYRKGYIDQLERLLPRALWSVVSERDDDPAKPQ